MNTDYNCLYMELCEETGQTGSEFISGIERLSKDAEQNEVLDWWAFFLGRKFYQESEFEQSIESMNKVCELSKDRDSRLFCLAQAYIILSLQQQKEFLQSAKVCSDHISYIREILENDITDDLRLVMHNNLAAGILNLACNLFNLDMRDEAIAACNDCIERYKDSEYTALTRHVKQAQDLIEYFSESKAPKSGESVDLEVLPSHEMFHLGMELMKSGRLNDALYIFHKFVEKFGNSDSSEDAVAKLCVLNNIGNIYSSNDNFQEAVNAYDKVIQQAETCSDERVLDYYVDALESKSNIMFQTNNPTHGLDCSKILIEKFKDSSDDSHRLSAARAYVNTAWVYGQIGDFYEQINTANMCCDKYKSDVSTPVRECAARILNNTGSMLPQTGRLTDAEQTLQKCIDLFSNDPEPSIHQHAAMSILNLCGILRENGDADKALKLYEDCWETFCKTSDSDIASSISMSLWGWACTLIDINRYDDAKPIIKRCIEFSENSNNSDIQELVATAKVKLDELHT